MNKLIFTVTVLCAALINASCAQNSAAAPAFTVVRHEADFKLPVIVFPYDRHGQTEFDWEKLSAAKQTQQHLKQKNPTVDAVRYLREGIARMTGRALPVVSGQELSSGIVLAIMADAPPEIRNDPAIQKALRNTGEDAYNANEAFYVRTEPQRVLIVANTAEGLEHGVVELLESVGYEVLGMGPNWTYVPDFHRKPLVFSLERAGRPGFYIRELTPTSGQGHGIGTLFEQPLPDPGDETVEVSYNRWSIGTRIIGSSMPHFPGNMLQAYQRAVVNKMKEVHSTGGFLTTTHIGPDAARPPASEANKGYVWINSDPPLQANTGTANAQDENAVMFVSDGKTWVKQAIQPRGVKLDLSVPLVRDILLDDFKKKSTAYFEQEHPNPSDKFFVFGTESEDGVHPVELQRNPDWYPQYLKSQGLPFGAPYALNNFKGLKQPRELWDPQSYSDTVFGFNNWLLHEYNKWIDTLPPAERLDRDGQPKKQRVRASLYSYSSHDVPPNFNLDPRIRVMIAGYPRHRGYGKWKNFASQIDIAQAFRVLLPREPAGDYWILSLSRFRDQDTREIRGSRLPRTIQARLRADYDAGFRALSAETDFNFGKQGLEYYLYSKLLWNPNLTVPELDALRDRWLQRAFGDGWREMKEYYDFMAPENYTVNAPNIWARAIRFIEAADQKIAAGTDEQRRLDDLKQFWYYYYLVESKQDNAASPAMKEFYWKGQMSYMTAMHAVGTRVFQNYRVRQVVGEELSKGPAHYTPEETAAWWKEVLDFWPLIPVESFADATLANGKSAHDVDLNDLVSVKEFQSGTPDSAFFYNSGGQENASVITVASQAGDVVGFKLYWPYDPNVALYRDKNVSYGISYWNVKTRQWQDLVDETNSARQSVTVNDSKGKPQQLVEVRFPAPQPGTYRMHVGYGGFLANLTSLNYDVATGKYNDAQGLSQGFTFHTTQEGLTQSPTYIYIPKGTKSLDLETWMPGGKRKLLLYKGLPSQGAMSQGATPARTVDVSAKGTHKIELQPGEAGTIAVLQSDGFYFPLLYSVPLLWAKSPQALLVPRAIAEADGLTILQ